MRAVSIRFFALFVVVTGFGFAFWSLATHTPDSPWYRARWETIGKGFERMEFVSEERDHIVLYRFPPEQVTAGFMQSATPNRVTGWSQLLPEAALVMNGTYFLEDGGPAGRLILQGQETGTAAFDLDKSGVLELAPDFKIVDTATESYSFGDALEAAQSYPFLIKSGDLAIKEDSGLLARRSFIGMDAEGLAYVGVVWKDEVSLFQLMQALHEMDVAWTNVLNLDGGPSTGLVAEGEGFSEVFDSAAPVPNVIYVELKK